VTPVGPFGPPSSGFGFGVPLSSASAIARGAGGNDLSDREQYERAILLLKETVLFRRMSWRLVGDLVMLEGIRIVHDAVDRTQVDFAVLVVLEGTLILSRVGDVHGPLESPIPLPDPPPALVRFVELSPGVYVRNDSRFVSFDPSQRCVEAPREKAFRYYALRRQLLKRLPTQVWAGLDPAAVGGNLAVLV